MNGEATTLALALVEAGTLSVDSDGCVWRHAEMRRGRHHAVTARRAESVGAKGYFRIVFWVGRRCMSVAAHRLVWEVLRGPIPDGLQINHIDLNKQNNTPANLEVVTGEQNIRHSYANGRPMPWCRAAAWRGRPRANTAANKTRAVEMRAAGEPLSAIAAELGVSISHASRMAKVG